MHCNLRPPTPSQSFSLSLWDARAKFEVGQPISCCRTTFSHADTLLYAVTLILTFNLWPWIFLVYRLWRGETPCQIWAKSNNSRQSSCDLNILPCDLNTCHVLCSVMIFTKFKPSQPIRSWNVKFDANALCNAVTLTFDPLTLYICSTSGVTWLKSVRNLSDIEQSPVQLLTATFSPLRYAVTLTFDCLTLNVCSRSDVTRGPGGIQVLSERPTGFLQCFDAVGLVVWPVHIVPDMTYNVFGGTLNLAQSATRSNLYQVWVKSNNSRLSYRRFNEFFQEEGQTSKLYSSEGVEQTASNLRRTELHHRCTRRETFY